MKISSTDTRVSPKDIVELASLHLRRYRARLSRLEDTEYKSDYKKKDLDEMVAVWESIQSTNGRWERLTEAERTLVQEAYQEDQELISTGGWR